MKPNYKNWIPKQMKYGLLVGTLILLAGLALVCFLMQPGTLKTAIIVLLAVCLAVCGWALQWSVSAYNAFSYDGKRKLSKTIVDGTAQYLMLPEGGIALDVGCGSGALTIAVAKRNPKAEVVGCDLWGREYAYSKKLCEDNAKAEGVSNVRFEEGNAVKLPYEDGSFDAVTSNYVYHNISGADKQALLKETLRVLKKGGTFAIHDLMSEKRCGDMHKFVEELKAEGYRSAELIDTTKGKFMTRAEAKRYMLTGSTILYGRK